MKQFSNFNQFFRVIRGYFRRFCKRARMYAHTRANSLTIFSITLTIFFLSSLLTHSIAQSNTGYITPISLNQEFNITVYDTKSMEPDKTVLSEDILANCKDRVSSDTKTANKQWRAKGKAKRNWKKKVKNLYGKKWKKWRKAKNKDWNCYGPVGDVACVVRAEPCK